jgi:eukaryotic translation initiation factor 2C
MLVPRLRSRCVSFLSSLCITHINKDIDPAVYYAHLASNRARCHESGASSDGPKGGQKYEEAQQDAGVRQRAGGGGSQPGASSSGSQAALSEARPLVPLACDIKDAAALKYIRTSMWYI